MATLAVMDDGSDDDLYQAVDLISESESGDPEVEEAEERIIIDSEEEKMVGPVKAGERRSSTTTAVSDWDGLGLDVHEVEVDGLMDDSVLQPSVYFANEMDVLNGTRSFEREHSMMAGESKRVRFSDEVAEAGPLENSFRADEAFPELFMQQDLLDPEFRQMIEDEQDEEEQVATSMDDYDSYEAFAGGVAVGYDASTNGEKPGPVWSHQMPAALDIFDDNMDMDDGSPSSEGSSSGYETDEGETTDEDLPPPQAIARTRSVLRRPSTSSLCAEDEEHPAAAFRRSVNRKVPHRIGPSLGSWIADPSKPIAVIDSTGKRMIIYPASRPKAAAARADSSGTSTMTSSPQSAHARLVSDSDDQMAVSHGRHDSGGLMQSASNMMMGGLLHGAPGSEFVIGGQVLGPPEAFYPFRTVGPDGRVHELEEEEDDDDDDDDEKMLNVNDFIDFGDSSSSEQDADDDDDDDDDGDEGVDDDTIM